ncbi:hypothetical protein MNEG_1491 [Monoraphidium neglectum]|uniref:Uncharacterized protein n=1 Tax=Monoraphidium neglectum TaxID=145388 RepID=A0A0D2N1S1_9CHLO|nr:hypothetical protein MNEG_1491 [Monoraphidium neglectum]KIZ06457.1 hypothetical protein MNEG_1491 [Monoraphidium neglectum]|eukprot:XP_013905476.1 hypothetical protein MNEG_1491 [Monoraphidium neglectum]
MLLRAALLLVAAACVRGSSNFNGYDDCEHVNHGTSEQRALAASAAACTGVAKGGGRCIRPLCMEHIRGLPWQWRIGREPAVRILKPGEAPETPLAKHAVGLLLRAAACPKATKRHPRLATRWARGGGGGPAETTISTIHAQPALCECISEYAAALLPRGVFEAVSSNFSVPGVTRRAPPSLALFDFIGGWWELQESFEGDLATRGTSARRYAVRAGGGSQPTRGRPRVCSL